MLMGACLLRYKWLKLPRAISLDPKGILGHWAHLAARAAFRKGIASYCGHRNPVEAGTWAGGIVGLNFCRDFLNKTATNAKMCDIIKNAEHFLSLGGEKILAVGGDFDGADIPSDMTGIESMSALYEMFLHHNYSEALVEDIFFNNALSFFERYDNQI